MAGNAFLGIDAGTQGLSVVMTDGELRTLATGEANYEMVGGLPEGHYEQQPSDWLDALRRAMEDLRDRMGDAWDSWQIAAIGVSGQMHGEVLCDAQGLPLKSVRLWCDARNEAEGHELTQALGVKMPKRITAARWLWTTRNLPQIASQTRRMTTPAGWLAYQLTGEWNLGIGDAAGMFPIDQQTLNYDESKLALFDELIPDPSIPSLRSILPEVKRAGQNAGALTSEGAALLGLTPGIPVAAAEGDQPASLAGSLIGAAGMVSISFGTSVCANSVGDRPFQGVSSAVDHFCAPDGKPINMVWLRNGTTYMNCLVETFARAMNQSVGQAFERIMPEVLATDPDCGGVLALPFMDDEPGLEVSRGGKAMLVGLNPTNASPGNIVKAALLATMFNLRMGCEVLDAQGFPRTELVLAGGLAKTPETGQILADVFRTPVTLLDSADEGTAWGAAVLAKYLADQIDGDTRDWETWLQDRRTEPTHRFEPIEESAARLDQVYARYRGLVNLHSQFDDILQVG